MIIIRQARIFRSKQTTVTFVNQNRDLHDALVSAKKRMYGFLSTSHVNTFLSITNDRGDDCHSEKASRIKKKLFFSVFVIFYGFVIFFSKMCVQNLQLSP